jgi:hypothetical protein
MNDVLLGWFTTLLVGLGIVLMLVIAVVLLPRALRIHTAHFYCPWRRRDVQVKYATYDGEHPGAVAACTAVTDPRHLWCAVHQRRGPAPGRRPPRRLTPGRCHAASQHLTADRLADSRRA